MTFTLIALIGTVLAFGTRFAGGGVHASAGPGTAPTGRPWRRWDTAIYAVTVLSLAGLGATGCVGWLGWGRLGGWLLLAHVCFAPLFIIGLTLMTVTLAEKCRFRIPTGRDVNLSGTDSGSWRNGTSGHVSTVERSQGDGHTEPAPTGVRSGQKAVFWAALVLGFVATASILMAMLPVFGYAGQAMLSAIHRYSGIALVSVAIVHGWLRVKRGGTR